MDWTKVNDDRLALAHPIVAVRVREWMKYLAAQGVAVLVTESLRTVERQNELYAQGRTKPGLRVTNARGGYSWHNFGLAVDVCPDDLAKPGLQPDWCKQHEVWNMVVASAAQFRLKSGATWASMTDFPHVQPIEIPDAPNDAVRKLYADKGMKGVATWFAGLVPIRELAAGMTAAAR